MKMEEQKRFIIYKTGVKEGRFSLERGRFKVESGEIVMDPDHTTRRFDLDVDEKIFRYSIVYRKRDAGETEWNENIRFVTSNRRAAVNEYKSMLSILAGHEYDRRGKFKELYQLSIGDKKEDYIIENGTQERN